MDCTLRKFHIRCVYLRNFARSHIIYIGNWSFCLLRLMGFCCLFHETLQYPSSPRILVLHHICLTCLLLPYRVSSQSSLSLGSKPFGTEVNPTLRQKSVIFQHLCLYSVAVFIFRKVLVDRLNAISNRMDRIAKMEETIYILPACCVKTHVNNRGPIIRPILSIE